MKSCVRWAALAVPALLLLLVYAGDEFREPLVTAPLFFTLLGVLVLGGSRLFDGAREDLPPESGRPTLFARGAVAWWIRGGALLGAALLAILWSSRPYQKMLIYPLHTTGFHVASALAGTLLLILLVRPLKPWMSLAALAVAGLAVRACSIDQWAINPAKRDMLALVLSAIESFLRGDNPYAFHQMQVGSQVPLTYPPALWLAYVPAHLLGVDIRWTSWIADAVVLGSLGAAALVRGGRAVGPVFAALAAYIFLPDVHWNAIYAEPQPDWAVLALLAALALVGRPVAAGAVFGVALAMRPFNVVLFPFLAIWLVRGHGWRTAWRSVAAAGAVAGALYLPFVLRDPDAFYVGTVRWLLDYGPAHKRWFRGMMGFAGPLYESGLDAWLKVAQAGILLGLTVAALFLLRSTRGLLAFASLAYALFVAFNSIIWMSFWMGACLLAAGFAVAADRGDPVPRAAVRPASRARAIIAPGAVFVCSVVAVGALATLLALVHRHFDETGRDEARAFLEAELGPGDAVLDRTGWRVAFLDMPFVLDGRKLPQKAVLLGDPLTEYAPRRGLVDPFAARRVFAVERYGLLGPVAGIYLGADGEGPYAAVEQKDFGRFRVVRLERRSGAEPRARLSEAATDRTAGLKECRFERGTMPLIAARPLEGAARTIGAAVLPGSRWVTVLGGLEARQARWRQSPIRMEVTADSGRPIGAYEFPDAPGLFGTTFALPRGARRVELALSAKSAARRSFCFDAIFSGDKGR